MPRIDTDADDVPSPGAGEEPEGPLARWSRRKRADRLHRRLPDGTGDNAGDRVVGGPPVGDPVEHGVPASGSSENAQARPPTEGEGRCDELPTAPARELPPLETLDENSDYSGFLSSEVSEDLHRAALRKLFRSAMFNVRDGLDDYDEDFSVFAPLGDVMTVDRKFQMQVDEERERERLAALEEETNDSSGVVDAVDGEQRPAETSSQEPLADQSPDRVTEASGRPPDGASPADGTSDVPKEVAAAAAGDRDSDDGDDGQPAPDRVGQARSLPDASTRDKS